MIIRQTWYGLKILFHILRDLVYFMKIIDSLLFTSSSVCLHLHLIGYLNITWGRMKKLSLYFWSYLKKIVFQSINLFGLYVTARITQFSRNINFHKYMYISKYLFKTNSAFSTWSWVCIRQTSSNASFCSLDISCLYLDGKRYISRHVVGKLSKKYSSCWTASSHFSQK